MLHHEDTIAQRGQVVADRRALHRIPEEGTCEHETQAYLMAALRALRPDELRPLAGTGLKAVFQGTGPNAIALRADIDALALQEQTGSAFCSQRPGYMHACGHDGHMAMLLAAARLAAAARAKGSLGRTVVLLLQPAEESIGGAQRMIEEGALSGPDVSAVYGFHLMPQVPKGRIALSAGPVMASTCELDIDICGSSAHGAMPHQGVDAAAAACHLYALLQTLASRKLDPLHPALITVGKISAGDRRNIIARQARLECIVRAMSDDTDRRLMELIAAAGRGVDEAFGTRTTLRDTARYPAVVNDEALTAACRDLWGACLPQTPLMAAEDFAYYQRRAPGVFAFVGCGDERHSAPLHAQTFDFDEECLLTGVEAYRRVLLAPGA